MEDVRNTGFRTNSELTQEIAEQFTPDNESIEIPKVRASKASEYPSYGKEVSSPINIGNNFLGKSRYDAKDGMSYDVFHNQLNDIRANNQPGVAKLAAGITKGGITAGTVFLDGTVGLLYGLGSAIANIGNKNETATETFSRLWDNEVSNGLQTVNQKIEEILPNYYTDAEQNNPFYKNLGTVNFWADGFLKNLGFTVGAMYSGSAFNAALKGVGLLKGALGAEAVGSIYSAINEARIEANNNSDDWEKLQKEQIDEAYNRVISETNSPIQRIMADTMREQELSKLAERKAKMGLTDFIGNTILLSLDNIAQFGKIYSRGYNSAEKVAGRNIAGNVVKEGDKYIFNPESILKTTGKAIGKGLTEGNEEMAQALISEYAGNRQSYDSPDAYYLAMTDPNAFQQNKDFLTSVTEGFVNTYGNGDKYEEFAIGALTGLLGVPTFGKASNMGAETYLGRGKVIGLSGGVGGEFTTRSRKNALGKEAVENMNNFMSKYNTLRGHFQQNQSFSNAMDGWASENNAFEYKNSEDNDLFTSISSFDRTGRLDDLKQIVNQDFENISDEELSKIAQFTTKTNGTLWKDIDGTFLSESEDGRKTMREELVKKRDSILKEIDNYVDSINIIRSAGFDSLTPDKEAELAWLQWKTKKFESRFKDIQNTNKDAFKDLLDGLNIWKQALESSYESFVSSSEDNSENIAENRKMMKEVESIYNLVQGLSSKETLSQIGQFTDKGVNPIFEVLKSSDFYSQYAENAAISKPVYDNAISNLEDISKLATAQKSFIDRLQEYTEHPERQDKNREKIAKKAERQTEAINNTKIVESNRDKTVGELARLVDDDFETMMSAAEGMPQDDPFVQTVQEAAEARTTKDRILEAIDNSDAPTQTKEDAKTLVENSFENFEDFGEFLNNETEAMQNSDLTGNDSSRLYDAQNLAASAVEDYKAAKAEIESIGLDGMPTVEEMDEFSSLVNSKDAEEKTGKDGNTPVKNIPILPKEKLKVPSLKKESTEVYRSIMLNYPNKKFDSQSRFKIYNIISPIISAVYTNYNKGYNNEETYNSIMEMRDTKVLTITFPVVPEFFKKYIDSIYTRNETGYENPETSQNTNSDYTPTLIPSESEVKTSTREISESQEDSVTEQEEDTKQYDYWKPQTTNLPIHPTMDYKIPYVERIVDKDGNQSIYTEALYKRMKAVHDYLVKNNAYTVRDSGTLKLGEKITFKTFKALNDAASIEGKPKEVVILMFDSQDRAIGDLASLNDSSIVLQSELKEFVKQFEEDYKNSGEDDFTSSVTTTIRELRAGIVPYSKDSSSLNTIFKDALGNPIKFKLGVWLPSGMQIDSDTRLSSPEELGVRYKLLKHISIGQPFVMMPANIDEETNSSKRPVSIPIPIFMPKYDVATFSGSTFDKALDRVLTKYSKLNTEKTLYDLKDALISLFSFNKNSKEDSSLLIETTRFNREFKAKGEVVIGTLGGDDTQKVKISALDKSGKRYVIYEGNIDNPNLVQEIKEAFSGQQISINRAFINKTPYIGGEKVDYNSMIGELASAYLVPGMTHTIDNWFILNIPSTIKSEKQIIKNAEESIKSSPIVNDGDSTSIMDADGIFGGDRGAVNKKLWDDLPQEIKNKIAEGKTSDIRVRKFEKIQRYYNDNGTLPKDVESYMKIFKSNARNRINDSSRKVWNEKAELSWLSKTLPNLSSSEHLVVIRSAEQAAKYSTPDTVWGQFKDGMIIIQKDAATGTVYHEAFHAVTSMLLSDAERTKLFDEARNLYGSHSDVELEELLAEDFREYVQTEEIPVLGTFAKLFRKIKHFISNLAGKNAMLDTLFYNINNGYYSNNTVDYNSEIDKIKTHYSNKLAYNNLDEEQSNYLKERSISEEVYNQMSTQEKEILFKCM